MRPEKEPDVEAEIWSPDWRCFCCHDTGIIVSHLAAMAIDGYDRDHDKFPRCVNPGCRAGSDWDSEALTDCVDYRINAATCQKLDAIEREDWRQTTKRQQTNIVGLAQKMSLRKRDRTPNEETEARRRHEEVCHANSAKLKAAAQKYLGNDYMKNGTS